MRTKAKKTGERLIRYDITINDGYGKTNVYRVKPLEPDPQVAKAAWRFSKLNMTDPTKVLENHDLRLDEHGLQCDCRGFERFGYCKHTDGLKKLLGPLVELPVRGEKGESAFTSSEDD